MTSASSSSAARTADRTGPGGDEDLAGLANGMVVDFHVHIVVTGATTESAADGDWRIPVRRTEGGLRVLQQGRDYGAVTGEFMNPAGIAAEAAARGIDHILLSPWVRLLPTRSSSPRPGRSAGSRTRLSRDRGARIRAGSARWARSRCRIPLRRRASLATCARWGWPASRWRTNVAGRFLGDDAYEPFWQAAADTGALVFIHPSTHGLGLPALQGDHLWNTVGNPMETAMAAAHLIVSGVVERHPGARILLAHGGGAVWSARGRLRRAFEAVPGGRGRLTEPPDASLARLYFDTVTHDSRLLRRLVADAGASHVLLGSDQPFSMGSDDPVAEVRSLCLPPGDEAAVLGGNALRLLGLVRDQ